MWLLLILDNSRKLVYTTTGTTMPCISLPITGSVSGLFPQAPLDATAKNKISEGRRSSPWVLNVGICTQTHFITAICNQQRDELAGRHRGIPLLVANCRNKMSLRLSTNIKLTVTDSPSYLIKHELQKSPRPSPFVPRLLRRPVWSSPAWSVAQDQPPIPRNGARRNPRYFFT